MPPDDPAARSARPEGSAASSAGSWEAGSNPFVGDAGPQFDPETDGQPGATPLRVLDVEWQAARLRTMIRAQGLLTHEAFGVGEEDWLWRDSELAAISEPAANVLNKFPVTRAAAAVSDELTVAAVMAEYAARSIRERARVIRAHKQRQQQRQRPQPITGFDAEGQRVTPAATDIDWETTE